MKRDLPRLRSAAEGGDPISQYVLYLRLREQGEPVAVTDGWLRRAAEGGLPQAQFRYADRFYEKDKTGAYGWELKAAQAGLKKAQLSVAEMCLEGLGTARDLEAGLRWLHAASDQQLPAAQYLLAMLYACGNGEPRHANETPVELLEWAADGGHPDAMLELARRFRVGQGVARDYLKACAWITNAEATGGVARQDEQSLSYVQGDAEFREFLRVLRVYRAATEGHDPDSMFQLGEIARSGQFGDPDYQQSYYWHSLAARHGQGQSAARLLSLKEQLTPDQIRTVTDSVTGQREP
jgi:hypothetical protein